jgi:hypothetical protein
MSGLEKEAQDLQRQKQEITKQVHYRHDVIVTWAGRARDEVRDSIGMKKDFVLWSENFQQCLVSFLLCASVQFHPLIC